MNDIQRRALESLCTRRMKLYDNYKNMSCNHQMKVSRQGEVIDYLVKLVNKDIKEAGECIPEEK